MPGAQASFAQHLAGQQNRVASEDTCSMLFGIAQAGGHVSASQASETDYSTWLAGLHPGGKGVSKRKLVIFIRFQVSIKNLFVNTPVSSR
ncbi:hypothetical protein DCO57_10245 [Labrenzia sp. 011]|nr:hypothetical protein DCO57_10245 [Labrenzia sp. 011]